MLKEAIIIGAISLAGALGFVTKPTVTQYNTNQVLPVSYPVNQEVRNTPTQTPTPTVVKPTVKLERPLIDRNYPVSYPMQWTTRTR